MNPRGFLSIAGPALTTAGAALLAYDVLGGPARVLRDRLLTERIDIAGARASNQARQRARAYWLAVWGLLLVLAGGAAETIAAVMAQSAGH